jgi:SAM-dependent methyltransferase
MPVPKQLRLNIGCGSVRIPGYINIDSEKSCKPDLILDVTKKILPYESDSVDEILFFHAIEHIKKHEHRKVLLNMARVLKIGGSLYISYPNFWECAKRWHSNTGGQRKFWEATLYGRQLYPGDYHVCAIDPDELTALLYECGFKNVVSKPEPIEVYNTVTVAIKSGPPIPSYETIIKQDVQSMVVKI